MLLLQEGPTVWRYELVNPVQSTLSPQGLKQMAAVHLKIRGRKSRENAGQAVHWPHRAITIIVTAGMACRRDSTERRVKQGVCKSLTYLYECSQLDSRGAHDGTV